VAIFVIGAADLSPLRAHWRGNRLRMNALIDAGNQILFPGKPLDLPDTKRKQCCNQHQNETTEYRKPGGSVLSLCFLGGDVGHCQKTLAGGVTTARSCL
jgi:hypothetical protein